MEFKSQPCTDINQSRKLLELGLKKETADMVHQAIGTTPFNVWNKHEIKDDFYPAWSLHRLMEIAEANDIVFLDISKMYNTCIKIIEGRIHAGLINQEYLEDKQ